MVRRILYTTLTVILGITIYFGIRNMLPKSKIPIKEKEKLLITDYLLPEKYSRPRTKTITHVVIHYSSNALNKPKDPYNIKDTYTTFIENDVSAHYVIDRKGKIYRFVPEERVAYHAGKGKLRGLPEYENKLNDYSIGIELLAIGTREEMIKIIPEKVFDSINPSLIGYTNEQYEALNKLLKDIVNRNPSIIKDRDHIIGHDEYSPDRKTDPGSLFDWTQIGFGK